MTNSSHSMIGPIDQLRSTRQAIAWTTSLALLGFYFQVHVGLPFGVSYVMGILLAGIVIPRAPDIRMGLTVVLVAFASIAWLAFSQDMARYLRGQIPPLIQLILAVLLCIGLVRAFALFRREVIHKVAMALFVFMSVGILLEVIGILRPLSDGFRAAFYTHGLYANDVRDLNQYGWVRPKFFASEPSYLALFYSMTLFMLIATTPQTSRQIRILLFSLPVIVAIKSPSVLPALSAAIMVIIYRIGIRQVLSNPLFLLLVGLLGLGILYEVAHTFYTRIYLRLDPSLFVRLVRPFELVRYTMTHRPLLGYGIGGEEQVEWLFRQISASSSAPAFYRTIMISRLDWGAAHFGMLIQFGLFGSIVWVLAIGQYARRLVPGYMPIFWIFFIGIGFFVGALNTPFYWCELALCLAALHHFQLSMDEAETTTAN